MREVELKFVTEVMDPYTGETWVHPRRSGPWAETLMEFGYIVTDTEHEVQPEENQP